VIDNLSELALFLHFVRHFFENLDADVLRLDDILGHEHRDED
jgi:hypothetical protein